MCVRAFVRVCLRACARACERPHLLKWRSPSKKTVLNAWWLLKEEAFACCSKLNESIGKTKSD